MRTIHIEGELGFEACMDCKQLVSVHIAKGVVNIGTSAFKGHESLKLVICPPTLMNIGTYTFACCYKLETVLIDRGIN